MKRTKYQTLTTQHVNDARVAGDHNRRARRAAKSKQRDMLAPPEIDDELATERIRERFRKMRAEREAFWASRSEEQMQQIALERSERESTGIGGQWFLPLLLDAVPRWAVRHYPTDPDVRQRRAHELGELIAYSQGAAALADPDAVGTEKPGSLADVFNAIAEGLAIGAYSPGGATFAGLNWEVIVAELRVTHRGFCARYPVDDPHYWDTEPCANLVEATAIYIAEASA